MAQRKRKPGARGQSKNSGRRSSTRNPGTPSNKKKAKGGLLPKASPPSASKRRKPPVAKASASHKSNPPPRQPEPGPTEKPSPTLLGKIMAECDFPLSEKQINLFWQFHLRIRERNREINLTRIHNFHDVVIKHFVDCAIVGKLTELPSPLLDIGTGPGFPGVPLKILHPEVSIILAEGRRLRVEFLEEVRRCLRLPDLHIHGGQIHESYNTPVRSIVTRAVERAPATLSRARGCLCQGGRIILMKGPSVDPELAEVAIDFADTYKLLEDHRYTLPGADHRRRLVVFERLDGEPFPEESPE